jgi:cyanophycin synthetase
MANVEWPEHLSPEVVREGFGYRLCGYTIALEGWRRGLGITIHAENCEKLAWYTVTSKEKSLVFNRSRSSLTTPQAVKLIINKQKTKELLGRKNIPVPEGQCFNQVCKLDDLLDYADRLGYPVVIKPRGGSLGRGVFTNLTGREEVADYHQHLIHNLRVSELIIEKHVPGDDYRLFVLGDKVAGAVKRIPANITGDGKHTITQLIRLKNKIKRKNPYLSAGLIKKDKEVMGFVKAGGYHLDSVLPAGKLLFLRGKANASAGGDTLDVTDDLPDVIKQASIKAVESIPGLAHCGVDVIYDAGSGEFSIIELNSRAQIGINMYPTSGTGRDIPREIIDFFFPEAPRRHEEINPHLIFDLSTVLQSLTSGLNESVTLPPC